MRLIKLERDLKGTSVSFLSQFACGIGAFYMALSLLKDIELQIDFFKFLEFFVELTEYNEVPYSVIYPRGYKVVVNFNHDPKIFADQLYGILKRIDWKGDVTIYIPSEFLNQFVQKFKSSYIKSKHYTKDLEKKIRITFKTINKRSTFRPAFTLLSGFDYRGINPMLQKLEIHDINADIVDLRNVNFTKKQKFLELITYIKNKSVCLVSINTDVFFKYSIFTRSKSTGKQAEYLVADEVNTHVVTFLGIDNHDNAVILNPSLDSSLAVDDVLIRVPKDIFVEAFTGLFTCLKSVTKLDSISTLV